MVVSPAKSSAKSGWGNPSTQQKEVAWGRILFVGGGFCLLFVAIAASGLIFAMTGISAVSDVGEKLQDILTQKIAGDIQTQFNLFWYTALAMRTGLDDEEINDPYLSSNVRVRKLLCRHVVYQTNLEKTMLIHWGNYSHVTRCIRKSEEGSPDLLTVQYQDKASNGSLITRTYDDNFMWNSEPLTVRPASDMTQLMSREAITLPKWKRHRFADPFLFPRAVGAANGNWEYAVQLCFQLFTYTNSSSEFWSDQPSVDGEWFESVIGSCITTEFLGTLMKTYTVTEGGFAFITAFDANHPKGILVGSTTDVPLLLFLNKEKPYEASFATFDQLGPSVLKDIGLTYVQEHYNHEYAMSLLPYKLIEPHYLPDVDFTRVIDGRTWKVTVRNTPPGDASKIALPPHIPPITTTSHWQVTVCVPEDDLMGNIKTRFTTMIVTTSVLFGLVLLSILIYVSFQTYDILAVDSELFIDGEDLTVDQRIGAGSFASVYQGLWRGTPVAIKVMDSIGITQAFRDEAALLSNLRHPNIVLLMGVCLDPASVIMEFMELGSLYGMLHDWRHSYNFERQMTWLRDIAAGMSFLHSSQMAHRDLKSLNVLLSGAWVAKVADFGLSGSQEDKTVVGTLMWTAPEVLAYDSSSSQDPPDALKADVYSFGIVVWEVLTRSSPVLRGHYLAGYRAVLQGERPDVQLVPGHLQEFVTRLWSHDPHERPTMADIQDELLTLVVANDDVKAFKGTVGPYQASLLDIRVTGLLAMIDRDAPKAIALFRYLDNLITDEIHEHIGRIWSRDVGVWRLELHDPTQLLHFATNFARSLQAQYADEHVLGSISLIACLDAATGVEATKHRVLISGPAVTWLDTNQDLSFKAAQCDNCEEQFATLLCSSAALCTWCATQASPSSPSSISADLLIVNTELLFDPVFSSAGIARLGKCGMVCLGAEWQRSPPPSTKNVSGLRPYFISAEDVQKGACIGAGTTTEVFSCIPPAFCGTTRFVSKHFPSLVFSRAETFNFMENVAALRGLEHENVVPIVAACISYPQFIVCPLEEASLDSLLKAELSLWEQRGPTNIRFISRDIAAGLEYLHTKGITHGALNVRNVFVREEDGECTAVVADYGLSNLREAATTARVAQEDVTWIAPELIMGEDPTHHSDVYALAAIIHRLTSLPSPCDSLNVISFLRAVTEGVRPTFPSGVNDDPLVQLLQEVFTKPAEERPTTQNILLVIEASIETPSADCFSRLHPCASRKAKIILPLESPHISPTKTTVLPAITLDTFVAPPP